MSFLYVVKTGNKELLMGKKLVTLCGSKE